MTEVCVAAACVRLCNRVCVCVSEREERIRRCFCSSKEISSPPSVAPCRFAHRGLHPLQHLNEGRSTHPFLNTLFYVIVFFVWVRRQSIPGRRSPCRQLWYVCVWVKGLDQWYSLCALEQQLHETAGQQQGCCNELRVYGYMYGNPSCIPFPIFRSQTWYENTLAAEPSVSGSSALSFPSLVFFMSWHGWKFFFLPNPCVVF